MERFIGDSSPNPQVVSTDPVIKSVDEQIAAQKPTILNRYYESLPPKLVQSTISTLGGFMVDPSNPEKTMSDLPNQAKTEWAAWNKNPQHRLTHPRGPVGPTHPSPAPTASHDVTGALA